MLSVTGELAALDDALPFPPHLLVRLRELIGCTNVSYSELDRAREQLIFQASSAGDAGSTVAISVDDLRDFFRLVPGHPTCSRRTDANDWTSALKVSDFSCLRHFQRSEIWNELYRKDDINYWIDVGLEPTGKQTRVFIFTRARPDFDERDRLMLELLQPYLQQRYDDVVRAAHAADALATLEEGGTDGIHDIMLCSTRGVIEFASRRSRRLLATYFGSDKGRLPEGLRVALRPCGLAVVEREGRRLTIRAARAAGMLVLLLGERDVRLDQLTSRQREILDHVAPGATDAEVGAALDIAPATVKKHLEQIYGLLGVHTRTAAAAALVSPPKD